MLNFTFLKIERLKIILIIKNSFTLKQHFWKRVNFYTLVIGSTFSGDDQTQSCLFGVLSNILFLFVHYLLLSSLSHCYEVIFPYERLLFQSYRNFNKVIVTEPKYLNASLQFHLPLQVQVCILLTACCLVNDLFTLSCIIYWKEIFPVSKFSIST